MLTPDTRAEGNSLYEARTAQDISIADVAKQLKIGRSVLKAYEWGLAAPNKHWPILASFFGSAAMDSFRIYPTDSDHWILYNTFLKRDYPAKVKALGKAPMTLREWRTYFNFTRSQMATLFNITAQTYRKWERTGALRACDIDLAERLLGPLHIVSELTPDNEPEEPEEPTDKEDY